MNATGTSAIIAVIEAVLIKASRGEAVLEKPSTARMASSSLVMAFCLIQVARLSGMRSASRAGMMKAAEDDMAAAAMSTATPRFCQTW